MTVSDSEVLAAIEAHGSQRKAAAALGLDRRTVERRLARMGREPGAPRVLIIDIETRPMLVYCWGMFKQYISPQQVKDWGGVMTVAAKWHGDDDVMFRAEWGKGGKEGMIRWALGLLDEADAVVGWNSQKFDTRKLNAEFQRFRMRRPTPYRHVDLMRSQKRDADFPSNKLESRRLIHGREGKLDTGGFPLWVGAMNGDRDCRRLMQEYNCQDVLITENEFDEMRAGGWVRNLPNLSLYGGHVCPNCGSGKLQAHKPYRAETRRYALWVCQDCGTASRAVKCEPGFASLKAVA